MTAPLPRWLLVLTSGVGLVMMAVGLVALPRLLYPPLTVDDLRSITDPRARIEVQQAQSRLANDTRAAALQGLAGLLLALGAAATWRQLHVNREGQVTDRFTRAVDQLGSENVHVRIGGIYALERIARNSATDRDTVQFLLGAFVRSRTSWPAGLEHPTAEVDRTVPWMRVRSPDVQAAVGALGRRAPAPNPPVLYFSRIDLRSIALRRANLQGAKLRHSNLARAVLAEVNLTGGDLTDADLRQAHLERTVLTGANMSQAYLQGANLRAADLRGADLRGANLAEAVLDQALLTGARADDATTWPAALVPQRRRERGVMEVGTDR